MEVEPSRASSSGSEAYKKEYTTLGIAGGGVYATAPSQWSDTAVSITIYDRRLIPYLGNLVEGGVVIDKRPCVDRDDFVAMVVSGPMLKESLPAGCKEVFDFAIPRTVVPVVQGETLRSLDYIALDVYLDIWRKVGAKIGKRVGDTIVWENGYIFPIPPEDQRFFWTTNDS